MQSEQNRERSENERRILEEDMRDMGDKREMVAHWEQQINEIIHWFVHLHFLFIEFCLMDTFARGSGFAMCRDDGFVHEGLNLTVLFGCCLQGE